MTGTPGRGTAVTTVDTSVRAPQTDSDEAGEVVVELVGHVVPAAARRPGRRWLPSRAELVANLRGNLRDEVSVMLVVALFVAQVADLWTTHVALASNGLQEKNPLFRPLIHSVPGLADAVKLAAVALMVTLAMAVLQRPRARGALLLAAALSLVAPISNLLLVASR